MMLSTIKEAFAKSYKGFDSLPNDIQEAFAWLINEIQKPRRKHQINDGCAFIGCRELRKKFGRNPARKPSDHFKYYNQKLDIVEVIDAYSMDHGITKAYRLSCSALSIMKNEVYYKIDNTRFGYDEVLRLINTPTRYKRGFLQRGKFITKKVPINQDALARLHKKILNQDVITEKNWREIHNVKALIRKAKHHRSIIPHKYKLTKTGRWQTSGISLQTSMKRVRSAALQGFYDYDIENCHFAILKQLTSLETPYIDSYLANKHSTRETLSIELGKDINTVKACILAMVYGATQSTFYKAAINKQLKEMTKKWWAIPFVSQLKRELDLVADDVLKKWPGKTKDTYTNRINLQVSTELPPRKILAHIVQGEEALIMCSIINHIPDILVIIFDGFVTEERINTIEVSKIIYDETGLEVKFTEEVFQ